MVVPCSAAGASVANGAASILRGLDKRLELIVTATAYASQLFY